LFGTTIVISRFSIGQFSPTTYIGLRLAIVSLGFGVVYALQLGKRNWPKDTSLWGRGFLLGLLGTAIPMTGIVTSLQYLSSGLTSILITVNPAFTVLLAHFFLEDEPLTRRKGGGVLLALSGAVLLTLLGETGIPDVSRGNPSGYLLVMGAMLSGSSMTVYARKFMQADDAFDITAIRMFSGALIVIPFSLAFTGFDVSQVNMQGVVALFYAAIVGTFLGMLLSFYNIQKFGATAAVMTAYIIPVVTVLTGVLLLDEQITWGMVGGMLLIGLGVWMINRK
jgi:drug/metabolite transporter (DMT)-like permease